MVWLLLSRQQNPSTVQSVSVEAMELYWLLMERSRQSVDGGEDCAMAYLGKHPSW